MCLFYMKNSSNHKETIINKSKLIIQDYKTFSAALIKAQFNTTSFFF